MRAREKAARVLLHVARRTSSVRTLALALRVAGDNPASNAAFYFVGVRYFGQNERVLHDAIDLAVQERMEESAIMQPFLEIEVPRERRVPATLDVIEAAVRHIENGIDMADREAKRETSAVLGYARDMLRGDFARAYESWSAMSRTRHVLSCLDEVASSYPASVLTSTFSEDTTLAVVLPGVATAYDHENIERHSLIGRTSWNMGGKAASGSGSENNLVFLNLARFTELCDMKDVGDAPLFITKSERSHMSERLDVSLRDKVLFELPQPQLPTTTYTYLPVSIALWAMASLTQPATFYCGDFYLGEKIYQDARYDKEKHLASMHDVRWSYLAHDVFFVHASLSHWYATGKIAAHGRLESLLRMSGPEFVRCMEERWGSAVAS